MLGWKSHRTSISSERTTTVTTTRQGTRTSTSAIINAQINGMKITVQDGRVWVDGREYEPYREGLLVTPTHPQARMTVDGVVVAVQGRQVFVNNRPYVPVAQPSLWRRFKTFFRNEP